MASYRTHPCTDCGKPCAHNAARCQVCAGRERYLRPAVREAVTKARLASPRWKASVSGPRRPYVVIRGYAFLYRPDHPKANSKGYVQRSRLVAEERLGRALLAGEIVHHRDGDRLHDEWPNLEVLQRTQHLALHRHRGDYPTKLTAAQADDVRRRYQAGTVTLTALGKLFGVSRVAIRAIVDGRLHG